MRLTLILNRNAGTLRGLDPDRAAEDIGDIFRAHGHEVTAEALAGGAAIAAIERCFRESDCDAVVAGGGDGTISAASAAAAKAGKTLGILPLGTMNLFARSLAIPLATAAAAEAIAGGEEVAVDIGEVNGHFFVHHVTVGLHARMILLRARIEYGSRLGKIWASAQAWAAALKNPPNLDARIRADDEEFARRTAAILVSNNPLGEGHIPYADDPRQGRLGLYVANSLRGRDLLNLAVRMMLGKISGNPLLDSRVAKEIDIALSVATVSASVDGEIIPLETPLRCRLHRGALRVLKPSAPPSSSFPKGASAAAPAFG